MAQHLLSRRGVDAFGGEGGGEGVPVSILIKALFVLLAPFGLVALWLAVLADMGTSIAVTLNGLRLFRRGDE
jgi:cation transport ATPase